MRKLRIGIVTIPLANNYGGILQNYALQQVLLKMGHAPYTINIRRIPKDGIWFLRWVIHDLRGLFALMHGQKASFMNPFNYYLNYNQAYKLKQFVRRNIQLTKRYEHCPNKVIEEYRLDCLITGSDQVWRPQYNSHIVDDQYLGFASKSDVHRIAYAASFGSNEWEYSSDLEQCCQKLVNMFDAVSVREQSGVQMCRRHYGLEVPCLLDPTLLLKRTDYEKFCSSPKVNEPYSFVYLLDANHFLKERIDFESKRRGLRVIYKSADESVSRTDSIEMWLSLIANADMVYTDSFHGMLFSIIFEKQFVAFVNGSRGRARFDTMLSLLSLKTRIIEAEDEFPEDVIDYDAINGILNEHRRVSTEWLESSLSQY